MKSGIHVVLVEPRIPQNTGNIGRLCVASDTILHLIHPLGFNLSQKEIKRSGMDYWQYLDVREYQNLEIFWQNFPLTQRHFLLSTKAKKNYYDAPFGTKSQNQDECFLYFGREDQGLPQWLLDQHFNQAYRIPMKEGIRSINLATSVGIVLYEAIRQLAVFD